jgi:hypothetical protein
MHSEISLPGAKIAVKRGTPLQKEQTPAGN